MAVWKGIVACSALTLFSTPALSDSSFLTDLPKVKTDCCEYNFLDTETTAREIGSKLSVGPSILGPVWKMLSNGMSSESLNDAFRSSPLIGERIAFAGYVVPDFELCGLWECANGLFLRVGGDAVLNYEFDILDGGTNKWLGVWAFDSSQVMNEAVERCRRDAIEDGNCVHACAVVVFGNLRIDDFFGTRSFALAINETRYLGTYTSSQEKLRNARRDISALAVQSLELAR